MQNAAKISKTNFRSDISADVSKLTIQRKCTTFNFISFFIRQRVEGVQNAHNNFDKKQMLGLITDATLWF
jgi:hypothetical protein